MTSPSVRKYIAVGALTAIVGGLSGCESDTEYQMRMQAVAAVNQQNMSQGMKVVGTTSDGMEIKRIVINYLPRKDSSIKNHYVYVVGSTISVNYEDRVGKAKEARTVVTADVSGRVDEQKVLEMAEQIRKKNEERDRAEYERLREKFGE